MQLLRQHAAGQDHSSRIWALVQFELWHRIFIDDNHTGSRLPSGCGQGERLT
jgi:asparagine synthase (glutamine-hydrolysing)